MTLDAAPAPRFNARMLRLSPMMPVAAFAIALALPALSKAETLTGKAGYLAEWTVSATVAADPAREFSGPMTMTHTGLCTVNGPVEKAGDIHYRISGLFTSRMAATLTVDGARCTFSGGATADAYSGVMDCPGTKGVPLTISVK